MKQKYEILIEPGKLEKQYCWDLWRYRELFYFLAWKDILVRYKQTTIGVAWSVLRPVLTMLAFVFIFNKIAKLDAGATPYPILVFSGLLPWQLFSNSLLDSSNSLIGNSNLISKVYFPRMIIPVSSVVVAFIDFVISFALLLVLMGIYRYIPTVKIFALPFFILLTFLISVGAGLWLSALNVKFRDFRYVVPFVIQFGLYLSPIGFSSDMLPKKWMMLYSLNPLVGIINGFRWCLIKESPSLDMISFLSSIIITIFIVFAGVKYFRQTEKTFADKI